RARSTIRRYSTHWTGSAMRAGSAASTSHAAGPRTASAGAEPSGWGGEANMRLKDKAAIVTGAGSGIGRCIAETFAREGARVAVLDVKADAAKAAAADIRNGAIALACDVARKAEIDAALQATLAAFGGLDILVNNAGVAHVNKPVTEIDEAELDRVL